MWLTVWNWEPSVLVGLMLFVGAYALAVGASRERFSKTSEGSETSEVCVSRGQIFFFSVSALMIFFALISPLDEIGDHFLFSAHMVQHLLLTLVMPPFLLLGLPGWILDPLLRNTVIKRAANVVTSPIIALLLFNVFFAIYHVPALYDLTLRNQTVHIVVHLLLMVTAVITWMPILSPTSDLPRLPYPAQILYLFLAAIPPTILGAMITFADQVLYPTYAAAPRAFEISALADQQTAGMIMWIPGATIYLIALTIIFFKWFGASDSVEQGQYL